MSNPKSIVSVTDIPCSCGYLGRTAKDSRFPVRFDAQYNEYYFDHSLSSGTTVSIVLYHCPMCGGVASKSRRDESFANLSEQESLRVNALIHNLKTIEDIERSLGAPDMEETFRPPADFGLVQPGTSRPETGSVRLLTYNRLSKTADVQFTVYSNNKIERAIVPKNIGAAGQKGNPA